MKDGEYTICLKAGPYAGAGELSLNNDYGKGHDGVYAVEVQLQGQGPRLHGIANILMSSTVVHNSQMPSHYSLPMTGIDKPDGFSLMGIGPLGLIIELDAHWNGTSPVPA